MRSQLNAAQYTAPMIEQRQLAVNLAIACGSFSGDYPDGFNTGASKKMVKLTFNVHGYEFQARLHVLRSGFQSAVRAISADVDRARKDALKYQESVAQGGDWIGERDEDGYTIWDHADVLTIQIEAAHEAEMALRKAFIIALYHHWERWASIWTEKPDQGHKELVSRSKAIGYPIDPKLEDVRDLVNSLKHNSNRGGNRLRTSWPVLFKRSFEPDSNRTNWYEAVHLTNRNVEEAFSIVAASGPTMATKRKPE
jgi:hypothetical protein